MRRFWVLFSSVLLSMGGLVVVAQPTFAVTDGHGIEVLEEEQIGERQFVYKVRADDSLQQDVHVQVVLPTNYDPARKYPVLYLFHGTGDTHMGWVNGGDALATTAEQDLILVLPEVGYNGDGGGLFSDWWNFGNQGKPKWETYLNTQLVNWIDDNFPTIAAREGRAVAGLSQGGYGAAKLAAKFPDRYVSMGSFSGAPSVARDPVINLGAMAVFEVIATGMSGGIPFAVFGDPALSRVRWRGNDPATLAKNLANSHIALWTRTGAPNIADNPAQLTNPAGMGIEFLTFLSTQSFHFYLTLDGIEHHYQNDGAGIHIFEYWAQNFREYLPMLMEVFADPPARPDKAYFMTIEKEWTQWGWQAEIDRSAVHDMNVLENADASGFTFKGAGTPTITTPGFYEPGSTKIVTMKAPLAQAVSLEAVADDAGRLTMTLPRSLSALTTTQVAIADEVVDIPEPEDSEGEEDLEPGDDEPQTPEEPVETDPDSGLIDLETPQIDDTSTDPAAERPAANPAPSKAGTVSGTGNSTLATESLPRTGGPTAVLLPVGFLLFFAGAELLRRRRQMS